MRAAIAVVLVAFSAYSTLVVWEHGYVGFFRVVGETSAGKQALIDLALSVFIACGWLIQDARSRGVRAWPYVVAACIAGSIGLMLYLVMRPSRSPGVAGGSGGGVDGAAPAARA